MRYKFEVTYEWAGSTGAQYMSTDIIIATDEVDARHKFGQRHDGIRHKIIEIRSMTQIEPLTASK
jgi:hypothetical protein